jgi:hypothetical protein
MMEQSKSRRWMMILIPLVLGIALGWILHHYGWPGEDPDPVPAGISGQVWLDSSASAGSLKAAYQSCAENVAKGKNTNTSVTPKSPVVHVGVDWDNDGVANWTSDVQTANDGHYSLGPLMYPGVYTLTVQSAPGTFWCDGDDTTAKGSTASPVDPNLVDSLNVSSGSNYTMNFGFK